MLDRILFWTYHYTNRLKWKFLHLVAKAWAGIAAFWITGAVTNKAFKKCNGDCVKADALIDRWIRMREFKHNRTRRNFHLNLSKAVIDLSEKSGMSQHKARALLMHAFDLEDVE